MHYRLPARHALNFCSLIAVIFCCCCCRAAEIRQLISSVRLAGPTSFAPAIRQACKIVNDSGGKFHILLIIADGQVC